MELIDTHVHINFDRFADDLEAVRDRWQAAGVVQLVHSCVEPTEFARTRELADRFPELSFSVGLHPLSVTRWSVELEREIETLARSDARVVAIGETGLDFFKADNALEQQKAFEAQLQIAQRLGLPVIIHCRDAAAEMVQVLQHLKQHQPLPRCIMHCWAGSAEEVQWFIDLDFYISFSGIVTFKNATAVQAAAACVPLDRLLIETDCPFLAPVPQRGQRNEPAYVSHVAAAIAELRGLEIGTIATQTTANARRCFNLPAIRRDNVCVSVPAPA